MTNTTTTRYTFCKDTVSDLHKDAYGFRPSETFWSWWDSATDGEKQAEWDDLHDAFRRTQARERAAEEAAVNRFFQRIASLMHSGARDQHMAIRWLVESVDCQGDLSFACYLLNLPYSYEKILQEAMDNA